MNCGLVVFLVQKTDFSISPAHKGMIIVNSDIRSTLSIHPTYTLATSFMQLLVFHNRKTLSHLLLIGIKQLTALFDEKEGCNRVVTGIFDLKNPLVYTMIGKVTDILTIWVTLQNLFMLLKIGIRVAQT